MDSRNPQAISQKLSPTDLKNKEFKRTMWGYSPKEVVEFLDATAKVWEKVQKQEKDLLDRIQSLSDECLRFRGREGEFQREREKILSDAEATKEKALEESQRIYAEVEERVNSIRAKTEQWLEMVIAQVEETERQKSNFVSAFRSALDGHYELLKREEETAEPLGVRLNTFLKTAIAGGDPELPS